MRRLIISFVVLMLTTTMSVAQHINHTFEDVSMPEALKTLATMSDKYTINFVFDDLEDYRVTANVKSKNMQEAIEQVIGFYPIRFSTDERNAIITVECIQKSSTKITGRISDHDGSPMGFANIVLLHPADSTYINGGVSNPNGDFVIPCSEMPVLAKISFVGYRTMYKHCNTTDIGTIKMQEEAVKLKQVKVKGELPIVKAENGKLEYNMPLLLQQIPADNAFEALTCIPGVYENNGSISFAGQSATLIIDGKPTTLSAEQIVERLKSMPADQVEKAEVMMSAPARYHVRGLVINVVTKDYVGMKHLAGQVQTSWTQSKYGLGNVKGSMLYQNGKFGLDATYGFMGGSQYGQVEHEAHHSLGDKRVDYANKTKHKANAVEHDYRIGVEYAFAEDNRLDIAYTGNLTFNDGANTSTGMETSIQKSFIDEYMHNVDANYTAPFGLQLGVSYTGFKNPQTQELDGEMYDEVRQYSVESNQRIGKWQFTVNQTHKLKNNIELNYGAKTQFTSNESYQTTIDKTTGILIPDATSYVNYDERILNAYAGFSKQFSQDISLDASVVAEQYKAPKWNQWRIYPTFNLMWNVNKQNLLNLSFASDAVYPSYWSTMSDIYYTSAYSEIWGNPELKPYSIYDTNLTWQFKQRYTFSAFSCIQPGYAVQLSYQPSDRMAVIMKETNFDYSNYAGISASARFNVGQWLTGNINATGLYRQDKSGQFFDLPFYRKHVSFILSGNVSAKLLRHQDLRLIFKPFFQSKAMQGVYDIDPMFNMSAQLRWASNNGKWSIIANGQNIFNNHISTKSIQGNQNFTMRMWMNYASASLTAIYRIEGFKEKKHKEVDNSRMGH